MPITQCCFDTRSSQLPERHVTVQVARSELAAYYFVTGFFQNITDGQIGQTRYAIRQIVLNDVDLVPYGKPKKVLNLFKQIVEAQSAQIEDMGNHSFRLVVKQN